MTHERSHAEWQEMKFDRDENRSACLARTSEPPDRTGNGIAEPMGATGRLKERAVRVHSPAAARQLASPGRCSWAASCALAPTEPSRGAGTELTQVAPVLRDEAVNPVRV